ncbi:MAG: methyltransferase domain-containing protein [Nitrospirae bacterium]|nr:methyltransferase domain-containing protein [Nitrospirota bacterium]
MKQREGSLRSARAILPYITDLVRPKSVIDIGCGVGTWLHVCNELGIDDLCGVEGPWVDQNMLLIPDKYLRRHLLTEPLYFNRVFDLAISMEVAEHIPKQHQATYIDTLTRMSSVILFSAAIPHGGGKGHVNEQWQDYWVDLFLSLGYVVIDCVRPVFWNNKNVQWWYRQNTFLFVQKDYLKSKQKLAIMAERWKGFPPNIVHPLLFEETAEPRSLSLKKAFIAIPFGIWRILRRIIKHASWGVF